MPHADELDYYAAETFDKLSRVAQILYGRPLRKRAMLAPLPWKAASPTKFATKPVARAAAPALSSSLAPRQANAEDVILTLDRAAAAAKCETYLRRAEKVLQRFEAEVNGLPATQAARRSIAFFDAADFSVGLVIMAAHVASNSEAAPGSSGGTTAANALWRFREDKEEFEAANACCASAFANLVEVGLRDAAVDFFSAVEEAVARPHGSAATRQQDEELVARMRSSFKAATSSAAGDGSAAPLAWTLRYLEELLNLALGSVTDGTASKTSTPPAAPAKTSPVIPLNETQDKVTAPPPAAPPAPTSTLLRPVPLPAVAGTPVRADGEALRLRDDYTPTSFASTMAPPLSLLQSTATEPLSQSTEAVPTPAGAIPDGAADMPGLLKYEAGMSRTQVAEALTAFYTRFNPTKLADMAHIVTAFDGRYPQLFNALNHKYLNVTTEFVDPHYRAPLPVMVSPLEYRSELTVAEAVCEVAEFYQRVAPMKTSHAAAVVDRHREDLEKLYFLLNRKYLEGYGEPLTLEANGFDTAARTIDFSAEHPRSTAAHAEDDGASSSVRSGSDSGSSSSTLPPEEAAPSLVDPSALSGGGGGGGGGSWCVVQ